MRAWLIEDHLRLAGGFDRALEIGAIDDVVESTETRKRIAEVLATAHVVRGAHGNIPL